MPRYRSIAAIAIVLASAAPAHACRLALPIRLDDIGYADTVVVGRIVNYRIIRDEAFRRNMLASPNLSPGMRAFYKGKHNLLTDYARFEVQVEEVLVGEASKKLSVTWNNSTFGEPATMPGGPTLIALMDPRSALPPLRGPSGYIPGNREPEVPTVLQAPCSQPFLFDAASDQARAVRARLNRPTGPTPPGK